MDRRHTYELQREASQRLRWRAASALVGIAVASLVVWKPARAQFSLVPAPVQVATAKLSSADSDKSYRKDAARHIYATYPSHIHKGKLPPLMYAIAITETEIDADGNVVNASMIREPAAAKEVSPWVLEMIRKAGPYPKPTKLGRVKYTEVWLVDKTGKFQLDTLTEGQR
jgi:hypothetical protein